MVSHPTLDSTCAVHVRWVIYYFWSICNMIPVLSQCNFTIFHKTEIFSFGPIQGWINRTGGASGYRRRHSKINITTIPLLLQSASLSGPILSNYPARKCVQQQLQPGLKIYAPGPCLPQCAFAPNCQFLKRLMSIPFEYFPGHKNIHHHHHNQKNSNETLVHKPGTIRMILHPGPTKNQTYRLINNDVSLLSE